nr:hypothetical protein CFP56_46446 [Quercus suber]
MRCLMARRVAGLTRRLDGRGSSGLGESGSSWGSREKSVLENSMAKRGMPDISDELQSKEKRVQVNEERDGRENNLVNRLGFKVGLCLTFELSGLDTPNSQNFNLDQAHGTMDYLFGDIPIDIEVKAVGGKRKERILLEEISGNEEVGKKLKMEEEVMALGKIMAQHLGSALAVGQPHWEL